MVGLTVAILNYNGLEYLEACLSSIPTELVCERILIDNASTDESWKIAERYGFRVVHADNRHQFITGINTAIREASGDRILFSQADVVFAVGAIESLLNVSALYPHSIVQPVFVRPEHGIDNAGMRIIWPGYGLGEHRVLKNYPYATGVATSITFMTTISVMGMVGLYDNNFAPAYYEDMDWALRSSRYGVEHLVSPQAVVIHRHNESFSKEYTRRGISEVCRRNRRYLIRKHYRGLDLWLRLAVSACLDIAKQTFDVIRDWRRSANDGK